MKNARLSLRVLVVAERSPHARVIEDAVAALGHRVVGVGAPNDDVVMMTQRMLPDAVVIETEAPTRDLLHSLQILSERQPVPTVVFADRSDERDIRVAIRAGTSAFVVDGLRSDRVAPILEAAVARFIEFQTLRSERDEALAKLSERRAIERAKGILMRRRDLAEDAAHEVLRKMSINRGRRMLEVAESIITAEEALSRS
jgi:two-component system, response regulator / RNA-binding antiterminator